MLRCSNGDPVKMNELLLRTLNNHLIRPHLSPALTPFLPAEQQEVLVNAAIVRHLTEYLDKLIPLQRRETIRRAVHIILNAVAPNDAADPMVNAIARAIGVDLRTLKSASARRGDDMLFSERKRRSDALSDDEVDRIYDWWTQNTRPSANIRHVIRDRAADSMTEYIYHVIHYQEKKDEDMYDLYKNDSIYNDIPIGITKFIALRPFFVRYIHSHTCMCIKCVQLTLYLDTYNNSIRVVHTDECKCECDACLSESHGFGCERCGDKVTREMLVKSLVCEEKKTDDEYKCREGDCKQKKCGWAKKIGKCPQEWRKDRKIEWNAYEKNDDSSKMELTKKEGTMYEFMQCFVDVVKEYVLHEYVKIKQEESIRYLKENLKRDELILLFDYAESYSLSHRIEVQSEYFTHKSITLFTCVVYRYDDEEKKVVADVHYYISQDKDKDSFFTQHVLDDIITYYKNIYGDRYKLIHFVSDGASSHFKCATSLVYMRDLKRKHKVLVLWHFSAPGHGKCQA